MQPHVYCSTIIQIIENTEKIDTVRLEMSNMEMPTIDLSVFDELLSGNDTDEPPQSYTMSSELTIQFAWQIIIYVVGVCGNILVIFMILFLQEFKKITHWYGIYVTTVTYW